MLKINIQMYTQPFTLPFYLGSCRLGIYFRKSGSRDLATLYIKRDLLPFSGGIRNISKMYDFKDIFSISAAVHLILG